MTERFRDRVTVKWRVHYERRSGSRWSEPKVARCLNVGGFGMLLVLDEALEHAEVIRLHMRDVNRDSAFTLAQVRWSRPANPDQQAVMVAGIEFVTKSDLTHLSPASHS